MLLDEKQIYVARAFSQSPEVVFSHWTDADLLKTWWAPPGYRVDQVAMNPVPNGHWRIAMTPVENGPPLTVVGIVQEIEQPKRLVLTWAWERPDGNSPSSTVEVLFLPNGTGTKLEISHGGIVPDAAIPQHEAGWQCSIAQLAERLGDA